MKIIKISQKNTQEDLKCNNCDYFFAKPYNTENLKCPICNNLIIPENKQSVQERKNNILKYYKEYANNPIFSQGRLLNKQILQMMKEFKDDDFIMSILYDDLYKKIQESNKQLEKELEIIKQEQNRSKKIEQLIDFYKRAYTNVSKDELQQLHYDIRTMTSEEINNYINKYVTSWKNI